MHADPLTHQRPNPSMPIGGLTRYEWRGVPIVFGDVWTLRSLAASWSVA